MSPYERRALEALLNPKQRPGAGRALVPARARAAGARAGEAATGAWHKVPYSAEVERAMGSALQGLMRATTDAAMRTVSLDRVLQEFQRESPDVRHLSDIRQLDLQVCDSHIPSRRGGYTAGAMVAGAGTSLLVTGTTIATTVSGGTTAAVAIGALATDVAGTLAGLGRIIAIVAAHYGYDVREPEEEVFAAGVLSLAMAGTQGSKATAMTSLSRLTQQMMRRATWTQLRRHQLVAVVERLYVALGLRLTQKKLAQVIPVLGVAINAGLNATLVDQTFRRASDAYRLRFLTEKYELQGMPATTFEAVPGDAGLPLVEDFLPVDNDRLISD